MILGNEIVRITEFSTLPHFVFMQFSLSYKSLPVLCENLAATCSGGLRVVAENHSVSIEFLSTLENLHTEWSDKELYKRANLLEQYALIRLEYLSKLSQPHF